MRDPRRFSLAALAYLLATFPLGYLWHLNWFHARYEQLQMYRADVIIPIGFGSMLVQAVIYAALYPRLFAGRNWARGALGFGLTFGALAWSLAVLPVAAKYRTASVADFVALESAFTVLHYLVVSPLIALAWRGATEPRHAV
jgi:hypothetical protein